MNETLVFKYRLRETDFVALNRFVLATNRKAYSKNLFFTGLGTFVLVGLMAAREPSARHAAIPSALLISAAAVVLLHIYYRSAIRRTVKVQLAKNPTALEERTITLSPRGFREQMSTNDSFHTWSGFEFVGITPEHAFLHINSLNAYIIPRAVLGQEGLMLVQSGVPSEKLRAGGA